MAFGKRTLCLKALLSFTGDQLVGGAVESAAETDEGGEEDVGFAGLDFTKSATIQIHLFGQLFLSHARHVALATEVCTKFP